MFTNRFEGPVLDHRYYAGGCSPHYILNTRFRKPYNVESYSPQVCENQGAFAGQWREHIQRSQRISETPCVIAEHTQSACGFLGRGSMLSTDKLLSCGYCRALTYQNQHSAKVLKS